MHPPEIRAEALALVEQGLNDCEISRRLGIPRRTILDWRRPTYAPRRTIPMETCPRCWRAAKPMRFAPADYSALLGTYLGDGSISSGPRTIRLRIALDAKYPRPSRRHERSSIAASRRTRWTSFETLREHVEGHHRSVRAGLRAGGGLSLPPPWPGAGP